MDGGLTPATGPGAGRRGATFDWGYAAVLLVPLALLLVSTDWLYPTEIYHVDSWLYYGYIRHPLRVLREYPQFYFGDRLSWILPAAAAHHCLPPLAAHWVLKLSFFAATLLAFYHVAKGVSGRRAALLAAVLFGCYPVTLMASGWYYVDSAAVCYYLLALAFLLSAGRAVGVPRALYAAAGGAFLAAALVAYLQLVFLVPSLLAFSVVVHRAARGRFALGRLLLDGACLAAGAALPVALFAGYQRLAQGDWHYFRATLAYASKYSPEEATRWLRPTPLWRLAFDWCLAWCLALPLIVAAGSAVALAVRAARRQLFREPVALFWVANAPAVLLLLVVLRQTRGIPMLDTGAYSYLLAPMWFLALGPLMAGACDGLSARAFAGLAAACLGLGVLPAARPFAPHLEPLVGCAKWVMPALWVTGVAAFTGMALWPRGGPALAGFIAGLGCVGLFGVAPVVAPNWHGDTGGRRAYLGVAEGLARLERALRGRPDWVWLSSDDPHFFYLRGLWSAHLAFANRWPHEQAPQVRPEEANLVAPGAVLVVLSSLGPELAERTAAALGRHGVDCKVVGEERVGVGSWVYTLTYLETDSRRLEAEQGRALLPPESLTVADPAASGGRYRWAARGLPGTVLVCGPDFGLPAGHYRVHFALRTDDCTVAQPVARCDAVGRSGRQVLAVLAPRGTDFRAPNTFQTFSAAFNLARPTTGAEFRVFSAGGAGVGVDYIDVEYLPFPGAGR
jgi:hypothetical protein